MDELLLKALDLAGVKGAQYADVRLVTTTQERLVVRNGVVDTLSNDHSTGIGVRVLVNGCWGFASSYDVTTARSSAFKSNSSIGVPPGHPYSAFLV